MESSSSDEIPRGIVIRAAMTILKNLAATLGYQLYCAVQGAEEVIWVKSWSLEIEAQRHSETTAVEAQRGTRTRAILIYWVPALC